MKTNACNELKEKYDEYRIRNLEGSILHEIKCDGDYSWLL